MKEELVASMTVGVETTEGQFPRFGKLIELAKQLMNDLDVDEDEIVAAAKNVFDREIAPIDVKWIPNLIEAQVDGLLWTIAETLIRRAVPGGQE